jgi:hypothetical protein
MGKTYAMIVTKINKKTKFSVREGLEFQLLTYCFINKYNISIAERKTLVELVIHQPAPLKDFCTHITSLTIFKTTQSTRNAISKLERMGLIVKQGKGKKDVTLNPECGVVNKPTVLLDFQFLAHDSKQL